MNQLEAFVPVAKVSDFDDEELISVEVDDEEIMLCQVEGKYYAINNICSHAHVELSDGELDGCFVTCPLHFSQFDVRTGEPQGPPAKDPVETYEVLVVDDLIYIKPY
ncbi:bifunctional 3-phenylpropionate/cinnamic acid dioxygenase ferredoxin subunit [Sporosarcina sp. P13]|uniref:Rieske (2Fe-2S) protein n=1 Tax=Sporosarcina sp. P13 TaxID=2048263 RepID=UPI000C1722E7|nr:non-heme iron oxygenase ferredoxin subunit [Sporosarcina sp. P13]PIC63496.1 bifunctional 3-phenylpropionate/cinnamic acid dioxygenase ferredoxin subunit [Sporosarcina sp. P13]